ncbi:hypothetical protein BF49_1706 [Bradyrhizobium sp.]|nr:hypothetical protein BF49_1706 [Bradyrhizobium sp.]
MIAARVGRRSVLLFASTPDQRSSVRGSCVELLISGAASG